MLVIFLQGGIGNQLFQYALYTKLKKLGKRVRLDYSSIEDQMNNINRQTIFDVFELDRHYNLAAVRGIFGKIQRRIVNRVFLKMAGVYAEKEEGKFDPDILRLKKGYLHGYWQTSKYFADCEEELKECLKFKKPLTAANEEILARIKNAKCPVSLHVRLGDYTAEQFRGIFGNICTREYYQKAIAHIRDKYPDATFFVFSNEPDKVTEVIDIPNAVIVDVNDESTASFDMYLMSQCKHNILANSSFSWWAAWMNQNPQKEIVAPKKWFNGIAMPDICPDHWVRIE